MVQAVFLNDKDILDDLYKDWIILVIAQSAGAVEYTNNFSAEEVRIPNECAGYDTKQSDGKVPVMLELWECGVPLHCHRFQDHSGPEWKHLIGLIYGSNRTKVCIMLNWIVWNITLFDIETVYSWQTELFEMELFWTLKLYFRETKLFEIELFWHFTVYKYNLYLY